MTRCHGSIYNEFFKKEVIMDPYNANIPLEQKKVTNDYPNKNTQRIQRSYAELAKSISKITDQSVQDAQIIHEQRPKFTKK